MALHKRGGTWYYDFAVDGKRYRGTTKEKTSSRARMIESKLIHDVQQRKLIGRSRSVTLAKFSVQFLAWVESSQLELKSQKYYQSGWRMLKATPVADMAVSRVTTDEAAALRFDHSPSNANMAFRTLRRMLGKAAEWGVISAAPRIKLLKEKGRSILINVDDEAKLLKIAKQPLHDVVTIVLDTGMRPNEVFQMRWENINWETEMIFIPKGKTKRSRRFLPMSARVIEASPEWVFPSSSASGHLTTVSKAGRTIARKEPLVQLTGISDK
jgi:integrase